MDNIPPQWQSKQEEGKQQQQERKEKEKLSPFAKQILVLDDDPDITFTFKKAFEEANRIGSGSNKTSFHI